MGLSHDACIHVTKLYTPDFVREFRKCNAKKVIRALDKQTGEGN